METLDRRVDEIDLHEALRRLDNERLSAALKAALVDHGHQAGSVLCVLLEGIVPVIGCIRGFLDRAPTIEKLGRLLQPQMLHRLAFTGVRTLGVPAHADCSAGLRVFLRGIPGYSDHELGQPPEVRRYLEFLTRLLVTRLIHHRPRYQARAS